MENVGSFVYVIKADSGVGVYTSEEAAQEVQKLVGGIVQKMVVHEKVEVYTKYIVHRYPNGYKDLKEYDVVEEVLTRFSRFMVPELDADGKPCNLSGQMPSFVTITQLVTSDREKVREFLSK